MPDFETMASGLGQNLLGMLFGGGQQFQQPRYRGFPGNVAQTYTYNPGMGEWLMNFMFPGSQQRMAPPIFLQSDFDFIRQRSQQERQFRQKYAGNPLVDLFMGQGLQAMGFSEAESQEALENPLIKMGVNMAANMMFGPSAQQQTGQVGVDLGRFFAGRTFVDEEGMFRQGVTPEINREITDRLFQATYKDQFGLFKERPFFGIQEMGDIMRMGVDYGLQIPTSEGGEIDVDQLIQKTKSLAKVIEAGMGIYNTLDKEEVIKNIMDLTRGTIPISETEDINNIIYKINALAKSANVSIQAMQRVASEGAMMFDQMGIGGQTGSMLAARSFALTRTMTTGEDSFIRQETLARGGGAAQLREMNVANIAQMLGSNFTRAAGGAFMMAERLGDEEAQEQAMQMITNPRRVVDQEFFDMRDRLIDQMTQNIVEETGLPEDAARTAAFDQFQNMQQIGAERITRQIVEQRGQAGFERLLDEKQARELLKDQFSTTEIDNLIRRATEEGRESTSAQVIQTTLSQSLQSRMNLDVGQANLLAEKMTGTITASPEEMQRFRRQEISTQASALNAQARQMDTFGSSVMEKVVNQLKQRGLDTPITGLASFFLPTGPSVFTDPNKITDPEFLREMFSPERESEFRKRIAENFLDFEGFKDPRMNAIIQATRAVSGVRFVGKEDVESITAIGDLMGEMDKDRARENLRELGVTDISKLQERMEDTRGTISDFIEKISEEEGIDFNLKDISSNEVLGAFASFLKLDDSASTREITDIIDKAKRIRDEVGEMAKLPILSQMHASKIAQQVTGRPTLESMPVEKIRSIAEIGDMVKGLTIPEAEETLSDMGIKNIADFKQKMAQTDGTILDFTNVIQEETGREFDIEKLTGDEVTRAFASFLRLDKSDRSKEIEGLVRQTDKIISDTEVGGFETLDRSERLDTAIAQFIQTGNISEEHIKEIPQLKQLKDMTTVIKASFRNALKEEQMRLKAGINLGAKQLERTTKEQISEIISKDLPEERRKETLEQLGLIPTTMDDFVEDIKAGDLTSAEALQQVQDQFRLSPKKAQELIQMASDATTIDDLQKQLAVKFDAREEDVSLLIRDVREGEDEEGLVSTISDVLGVKEEDARGIFKRMRTAIPGEELEKTLIDKFNVGERITEDFMSKLRKSVETKDFEGMAELLRTDRLKLEDTLAAVATVDKGGEIVGMLKEAAPDKPPQVAQNEEFLDMGREIISLLKKLTDGNLTNKVDELIQQVSASTKAKSTIGE